MPDNDNDLSRRLSAVEQRFGLVPRDDTSITVPNDQAIEGQHTDNINWKALYKVLEAEVESVILDPNCPAYVRDWGQKVMQRLAQHLPRR